MPDKPEPTAFEKDLNDRVARAQAQMDTRTAELYPQAAIDAEEGTADITPAGGDTEAPVDTSAAPAAEPVPTDEVVDEEVAAAPPEKPEAAPAKTPAKAAPAPSEEKERKVNWKVARDEARKNQREIKRLNEELAALKAGQQPAAPAATPADTLVPTDDDPFGFKGEMQRLRTEIAQQNQQRAVMEQQNTITRNLADAEQRFRQTAPDYDEAVNYLVATEKKRYAFTGEHLVKGRMLLDAAEKFGDTDTRARALRDAIERTADQRDMSDLEAASEIALDLWIADQRNRIIGGAQGDMNKIPQTVVNIAKAMGWQQKTIAPAVTNAPPAKPAVSDAEKLRASIRASSAGKSLTSIPGSGHAAPDQPAIRTVQEWANFFQKNPTGAREYAAQMMKADPNWHRNLAAR